MSVKRTKTHYPTLPTQRMMMMMVTYAKYLFAIRNIKKLRKLNILSVQNVELINMLINNSKKTGISSYGTSLQIKNCSIKKMNDNVLCCEISLLDLRHVLRMPTTSYTYSDCRGLVTVSN